MGAEKRAKDYIARVDADAVLFLRDRVRVQLPPGILVGLEKRLLKRVAGLQDGEQVPNASEEPTGVEALVRPVG